MKRILTILILFTGVYSYSQTPPGYIKLNTKVNYIGIKGDSAVIIPGDTLYSAPVNSIAIKGGKLWIKLSTFWTEVISGSGVDSVYKQGVTDSIFFRRGGIAFFAFRDSATAGGAGDGNNYPVSVTFNPATGEINIGRSGLADVSDTLDGRWLKLSDTAAMLDAVVIPLDNANGVGDSLFRYISGVYQWKRITNTNRIKLTSGDSTLMIDVLVRNLGTGAPSASTFLRGDSTWAVPLGGDTTLLSTKARVKLMIDSAATANAYTFDNPNIGDTLMRSPSANVIQIKSLIAGTNVTLAKTDSTITINSDGGTPTTTDNLLKIVGDNINTNKTTQTLTDGATVTWNMVNGYNAKVTLGGNRTLAPTNIQEGDGGALLVIQDGTGGRTLTVPGGSVTLNAAPGDSTVIGFLRINNAYKWRDGSGITLGQLQDSTFNRVIGLVLRSDSVFSQYMDGHEVFEFLTGSGGSGAIGTMDSRPKEANGAVVFGGEIIMQSADTVYSGLTTAVGQTFSGLKDYRNGTRYSSAYNQYAQHTFSTGLLSLDFANPTTDKYEIGVRQTNIGITPVNIGRSGASYPNIGYNVDYTSVAGDFDYRIGSEVAWLMQMGTATGNRFSINHAPAGTGAITFNELLFVNADGTVGIPGLGTAGDRLIGRNSSSIIYDTGIESGEVVQKPELDDSTNSRLFRILKSNDSVYACSNLGCVFAYIDAGAAGSGVTTMTAIGSTPNANAATITGTALNLEPANESFGGVLTAAAQVVGGEKDFRNGLRTSFSGSVFWQQYVDATGLMTFEPNTVNNKAWYRTRQSDYGNVPVNVGGAGTGYPGIAYNVSFQNTTGDYNYRIGSETAYFIHLGGSGGDRINFNTATAGTGAITWSTGAYLKNNGKFGIPGLGSTGNRIVARDANGELYDSGIDPASVGAPALTTGEVGFGVSSVLGSTANLTFNNSTGLLGVSGTANLGAIPAYGSAASIYLTAVSGEIRSRTLAQTQADLGLASYELLSNKSTNEILGTSDVLYPTEDAVRGALSLAVTGVFNDRGNYDASGNVFPSTGGSGGGGAIVKGNIWTISVAGTLGGTAVNPGDDVRALVDAPGQTAGNWGIRVSGGALDADLVTIAGLSPSNDDVLQRKSGAWTNRTIAQLKTDFALVKADVGLSLVENTALSTWAGTSSITTLGTIGTGTWSASTIAVARGGTGQTTYADGQLLIGNTTGNTLAKATLAVTSGKVTVTNGSGTITLGLGTDAVDETLSNTFAAGTTQTFSGNTTEPPVNINPVAGDPSSGTTNGDLWWNSSSGTMRAYSTSVREFTWNDASQTLTNKTINFSNNTLTGVAPLTSPTFLVSAFAPTPAAGTNTTAIATTAFVQAAVPNASFRTLFEASGSHTAGRVAGTYGLGHGDVAPIPGTGSLYPLQVFHIAGTDYPTVDGKTTKLRVKAIINVNNVTPSGNFTFGLYPVTRPASSGGAGVNIYTVGTVITGSTVLFTGPIADAQSFAVSTEFALPADGFYIIAVLTTATVAASSHIHFNSHLQMRNN